MAEKGLFLKISEDQIKHAKKLAVQNEEKIKDFDLENYKSWKENVQLEDYIGFLGETVACDNFNKPRPVFIEDGFGDAHSFEVNGEKVNIKTTQYTGDQTHLLIYPDRHAERNIDRYILMQHYEEKRSMRMSIDIPSDKFEELCSMKDIGYGDRMALKVCETPSEFRPKDKTDSSNLDRFIRP